MATAALPLRTAAADAKAALFDGLLTQQLPIAPDPDWWDEADTAAFVRAWDGPPFHAGMQATRPQT